MLNDLNGKAVLVTGGTMGIGLATALAFARQGARCTLTYRWGSADEEDVRRAFTDAGLPEPRLVQADAGDEAETLAVLEAMRQDHEHVEAFISNAAFGLLTHSLEDYDKRGLLQSIGYSAWPLVDYTLRIKRVFGRYPRYVVGLSSAGPESFCANYDFIAAAKSVLETLTRYLSYRLFDEDVRVNVVRAQMVLTESFHNTVGAGFEPFSRAFNMDRRYIAPEEVAGTILALCSGLMDGVSGQVITVDRGTTFSDNVMRLYEERDQLRITPEGTTDTP